MTRAATRTSFHSSTLIRHLADLALIVPADTGGEFAEKLGQWVHFTDAIALSAVHGDSMVPARARQGDAYHAACRAAAAELDRVQAVMANGIRASCSTAPGKARIRLPEPPLELPADPGPAYSPYRRFYEAHQRDMEQLIQPVRTSIRASLSTASPALAKLALLDATLEKILREREGKLLAKVPVMLRKRFEFLIKDHQHKHAGGQQADDPGSWLQPGGWLARFHADLQMLLLAEAEFRLQPVLGLMEAYQQDIQ